MWLTSILSNLGELQLEILFDRFVAADLLHHLFLVQAVRDEDLEFVQADAERVEVVVHVGRPVQALDAAKLVGPLLDLVGGDTAMPCFFAARTVSLSRTSCSMRLSNCPVSFSSLTNSSRPRLRRRFARSLSSSLRFARSRVASARAGVPVVYHV